MNHTRFPKEDHLPDWARRDNKDTKGDRVEYPDDGHLRIETCGNIQCDILIYMPKEHSYNKSQRALFLKFILVKNCTYFVMLPVC